jgi:hypothetical protein
MVRGVVDSLGKIFLTENDISIEIKSADLFAAHNSMRLKWLSGIQMIAGDCIFLRISKNEVDKGSWFVF